MATNQQDRPDLAGVEVMDERPDAPERGGIVLARDLYPDRLPILGVERPLFPKMTLPLLFGDDETKTRVRGIVERGQKFIGFLLTRDGVDGKRPAGERFHRVGVVAEIRQIVHPDPAMPLQMLVTTRDRFLAEDFEDGGPDVTARVSYVHETDMTDNDELKAYALAVVNSIKELVALNPLHKEELSLFMSRSNLGEPGRLADIAAVLTTAAPAELQDVLETLSILQRLRKVLLLLKKEVDISQLQARINKQIEERLTQQQREFFLREQLKAIKKELGLEKEGKDAEIERYEKRLKEIAPPDEARERIREELDKLRLIEPMSPEFTVSRNYVDWLTGLPWGVFTEDNCDIVRARRILDRDHHGLEDVKERILEFLAVGILKGRISGTILCFVGPPGVGKTSLGQSIARSIGRNFFRFSLGGIRDEAEIKGHRRTYIGALPGKFIQTVKTCKSANPVIMLDEIDKVGASYQGDPASALLEVLDPEQNRDFLDHYLDVRFDLSNVFFICTANQTDTIPRPLLDRMEVIHLAGYIVEEKVQIARRHLIPKQLAQHGATRAQIEISPAAIRAVIDGYAREPGVRSLEHQIQRIIRKSVRGIVEKKAARYRVDAPDLPRLLGKKTFQDERLYKTPQPGVVMGLAWTSMGGDTLYVEAIAVETGEAGFKQTGQLGKVMIESSELAYTFVRGLLSKDAKTRTFFNRHSIHLHVPAGATPKDGPSAGITMAMALYSLATGRAARPGLAMTGELSLTGRVMPVGGIKEKVLAAKRAEVRDLLLPAANRKDFEELPPHLRRGLRPHFVSRFQEAVRVALH